MAWTLLACGGAFVATIVVSNAMARRQALASAEREAVSRADAAARKVEGVLRSVEQRLRLLAEVVPALDPGASGPLLRRIAAESPEVHGIAWIPDPGEPLYASRRGVEPLPPAYREQAWYAEARAAREPRWTEPHQGEGGDWLVACATPARDGGGGGSGLLVAQLSLDWLDHVAASLGGGGEAFGVILSRSGRLLAYPRRASAEAPRPLLEELPPDRRTLVAPIVKRMLAGQTGFLPLDVEGERSRLAFQPIGGVGWSLAVLYPERELLAGVQRLRMIQAALALAGLALLVGVVVLLSRRITRPLKALAASAQQIAQGELDADLPPVESRDELGGLARAFHEMRSALKEHIRELRETTAAKERLESELKVARRIQSDMLPSPHAGGPGEGYELGATLVPARAVGGDLFDHFRAGARVFFLVGDVSGKGVGAALFMARAKTLFEAVAAREGDPGAAMAEVNRGLGAENESGMYVTAVLGVLDTESGEVSLALAGHEPPVLLPATGAPGPVKAEGGPVLGLLDGAAYPLNRLRLSAGQALVLYTDGVSEARNPADELFESQRLVAALSPLDRSSARAVTDGLLAAVRAFAGRAPQSDDITILTLRYLARS
jgi:sigma-B regulation protein RsbU (phosphoserine phosphatase)